MRLSPGPPGMTLRAIRRNWFLGELPRSPQAQDRRELGGFCHHQHHDFLLMLPKQAAVLRVLLPETPVNLERSLPVKSSPRALFLPSFLLPKTCTGKSNGRNRVCVQNPRSKEVQELEVFAVCPPQYRRAHQKDDMGVKLLIRFTYQSIGFVPVKRLAA